MWDRRTCMRAMTAFTVAVVAAVSASCDSGDDAVSTRAAPPGAAGQEEEVEIACLSGERGFPAAALDAPTGAEEADTPEAEGLRRLVEDPDGIGPVPRTGWRLLDRDDSSATFGVEDEDGLTIVWLRPEGERWTFDGSVHGCRDLMVLPPAGSSAAVWWPDPDATQSTDDLVLHVLATDLDCASARPTGDRLEPPTVEMTADEVVVTLTAEPVTGGQECPSHPPTPYEVRLEEPIGERQLLDGAYWPPRPPEPRP
jgi:hypothetical protein